MNKVTRTDNEIKYEGTVIGTYTVKEVKDSHNSEKTINRFTNKYTALEVLKADINTYLSQAKTNSLYKASLELGIAEKEVYKLMGHTPEKRTKTIKELAKLPREKVLKLSPEKLKEYTRILREANVKRIQEAEARREKEEALAEMYELQEQLVS